MALAGGGIDPGRNRDLDLGRQPMAEEGNRQFVQGAGQAHHQRPDHGDDAEQVVQIQPFQAARAVGADGAEGQFFHVRVIQRHARYHRQREQQGHGAQEQLAGQTAVEIDVQARHERHDAAAQPFVRIGDGGSRGAVARIELQAQRRRPGGGLWPGGEPERDAGRIAQDFHVDDPVRAMARPRRSDDGVGRRRRRARRKRGPGRRGVEPGHDLFIEDQWQAREADHQQEQRTGQAGPFVDPIPGLAAPRRRAPR